MNILLKLNKKLGAELGWIVGRKFDISLQGDVKLLTGHGLDATALNQCQIPFLQHFNQKCPSTSTIDQKC